MAETPEVLARWLEREPQRRRVKFEQIRQAMGEAAMEEWRQRKAPRVQRAAEALELLGQLQADQDAQSFKRGMSEWAQRPGYQAFGGFGQMFINQLVNLAPDGHPIGELLGRVLTAPADEASARDKITELERYVRQVKRGGNPAPKRIQYVLSLFWSMQQHDQWPCMWQSAEAALTDLGWLHTGAGLGEQYLEFRDLVVELGQSEEVEGILYWFHENLFTGLDPGLQERCSESADILRRRQQAGDYEAGEEQIAVENAVRILGELRLLGTRLKPEVEKVLGRSVNLPLIQKRIGFSSTDAYRADGYTAWALEGGMSAPSLRVWVTEAGTAVGLYAGFRSQEWHASVRAKLTGKLAGDHQFFRIRSHNTGSRLEPSGQEVPESHVFVGRWFPDDQALGDVGLAAEVMTTVAQLRETLELILPSEDSTTEQPGDDVVVEPSEPEDETDRLADLAEELLLDPTFLHELADLLEDKGQIVFYGPPGTGKTFVARRLAKALARDVEERWLLVQFHPSMSYEDFFEGYRPEVDPQGRMTYRLTKGPLAIMTDRAKADSDNDHIIVIDEINRANLPKVLGELLFLLEYRKEAVRALYRPDAPFSLPKNLKFVGTMNTADRSIALIDAALRRRFHFVPFFPHEGAMAGLLGRWFERNGGPAWVADLVDAVNAELQEKLGGPHLQIGPSHFMRPDLDDVALERIWTYNIYPFIEEQLWGQSAELARYTWKNVLARLRPEQSTPSGNEAVAGAASQGGS